MGEVKHEPPNERHLWKPWPIDTPFFQMAMFRKAWKLTQSFNVVDQRFVHPREVSWKTIEK